MRLSQRTRHHLASLPVKHFSFAWLCYAKLVGVSSCGDANLTLQLQRVLVAVRYAWQHLS